MYDICIECIPISTSIFLVSKEPHKTYTRHDDTFSLFNKRIAGGGIVPKVDVVKILLMTNLKSKRDRLGWKNT